MPKMIDFIVFAAEQLKKPNGRRNSFVICLDRTCQYAFGLIKRNWKIVEHLLSRLLEAR